MGFSSGVSTMAYRVKEDLRNFEKTSNFSSAKQVSDNFINGVRVENSVTVVFIFLLSKVVQISFLFHRYALHKAMQMINPFTPIWHFYTP